ncbi:MAG: DUF4270 family protein [Bacteroidota bacterium]
MKVFVQCVYLLAPLILLFSCNDEASPIGSDFFNGGGAINMTTIDTLTIRTSTMLFDSLATADAPRLLVGYHEDADLGKVQSAAFFQLGTQGLFQLDRTTSSFTRVELRLIHDGYSYYDTTQSISFAVHQLKEQLKFRTDNIYNTSKFKYDPTPMGSVTYKVKPSLKDTVKIPLSATFGQNLIRLAQSSATQVSSTEEFLTYFYGLAIVPTGTSGPIVGFGVTPEVRIYYLNTAVTPSVEAYLVLSYQDLLKYNKISSDRSGTALSGLKSGNHIDADDAGGKGYMQAGVGLGLRLEIPYLRSILLEHAGLTILSAQLEISPSRDNDDRNAAIPAPLLMQRVNYKNQLVSSYAQQAVLVEDYYLERDTHYSVDVTTYVKQQVALEEANQNAIVFITEESAFRSTVNRVYIDDQLGDREMKLTITCLVY